MTRSRRFRLRTRYLLPLATLLLYLPFLTRTYYWDGVLFALNIESVLSGEISPAILIHPNHLLYTAFGYGLYAAAVACGLAARALTVLQVANAVLSAAAGYALYGLARQMTRSATPALFAWLLFTVGATWWRFSTDADSYILSVLLVVWAVRFALDRPSRWIAAAICHTLAMLFHELAIFAYAPITVAILLDSATHLGRRWLNAIRYGASTAAVVTGAYLIGYSQADKKAYPTLWKWVTSYASDSSFTQSWHQLATAYLLSYGKLFAGGKLSLLREFLSPLTVLALALCVAAIVISFRLGAIKSFERPRGTIVLWVWFATSAIFLAIWDPGSAFHKLFVWPPIVLLIASYLRTRAGIALAIALAAWNFAAFIYPHAHDRADPVLLLAEQVNRELPENATVFYRQLLPDDWYLEYFAPGRRWMHLPVTKVDGPVCMDTTALEALNPETDPSRRWDLVNSQHHIRLECVK